MTPKHLTQGVTFDARQPDQDSGITSIVVGDVVDFGCIPLKTFAFLNASPHDERVSFRGYVYRKTSHEDAINFEYG